MVTMVLRDATRPIAIEFAGFRLDGHGRAFRLDANGDAVPVAIGSRALDVLRALASRPGDLVSKREIMQAVWPDTVVEDKNLAMQVSTLRQILEREGGKAAWIQTVPGRGYRFVPPAAGPPDPDPVVADPPAPAPARGFRWNTVRPSPVVAFVVAVLLVLGGAGWRVLWDHSSQPVAYSPQDRRQSIIVLPFENRSGDAGQDSLAASLTTDMTDQLAQDSTMPVVPAVTAAGYREKGLDLRSIGRERDVRFALLGNARRQDGRVAVSMTLYETSQARQLWSHRFEEPDDPGTWARVAYSVHASVEQAMMDEDVARAMREHPGTLDKRDLMFASQRSSLMQPTPANLRTKIELTEQALAMDPDYVWALRENARKRAELAGSGFPTDPDRELGLALQRVDRALDLAPDDFWVLREKAVVLRMQGKWKEAAVINRRLIARRPLSAFRHQELGINLMNLGLHAEALEQFVIARQLAVVSDSVNYIDLQLAAALLATGDFRNSIEQARFAMQEFTRESGRAEEIPWLVLVAAEVANGQEMEARADMTRFLASPRQLRTIEAVRRLPALSANPRLIDGLRRVGMPEG